MKGFPDLPPIWLLGFLAAAATLSRGLPLVTIFGPVFQAVGYLLILAGMALIGWSAVWFFRKGTTIEPHHEPSKLIVEGPYSVSRNPIYLGLLAILAGYAASTGALSAILLVPAFYWVLNTRFVLPEEAALRDAFGAEAERYVAATRRWL